MHTDPHCQITLTLDESLAADLRNVLDFKDRLRRRPIKRDLQDPDTRMAAVVSAIRLAGGITRAMMGALEMLSRQCPSECEEN